MTDDLGRHYLDDVIDQFRGLRKLADGALAQVPDDRFFEAFDDDTNSIAIVVKHVGGNLRSRWTDFLITDGEKPDRDRDGEFERRPGDTRESIMALWEHGWALLFATLDALAPSDLTRTVAIRGEAHSALRAVQRSYWHTAYHVGQIVALARIVRAGEWRSLSIPRNRPGAPPVGPPR